jgi:HEPN domain-containing protein
MLAAGADYPRTHGVRSLLEILSGLESDEKKRSTEHTLNDYLFELGMLEDAYITSRYVMREFTREEAQRLIKTVKEVMNNVK